MIAKGLNDVPLNGLMCLVFIDSTKQTCAIFTPSIAPSVANYATARDAPALPSASSPLLPLLACDMLLRLY